MIERNDILRQLSAELVHWELAIDRLADLDDIASPEGWTSLERQTGVVLRATIRQSIRELKRQAERVRHGMEGSGLSRLARSINEIRRDYLRTETVLDFFADAINSRSPGHAGQLLRGLDYLASEGMRRILDPLGHSSPPVITYIDKGLGASILKAGLRLWDRRSLNPAASVKVVRHNLLTATSVLHEIGHQIAHITAWNDELRQSLAAGLPRRLSRIWSSWATEIAADAIAFVYAGHASLAALRTVVDGGTSSVFRFVEGDPHPIGMLRVLMVSEFASSTMAPSVRQARHRQEQPDEQRPWRALAEAWIREYPPTHADSPVRQIVLDSVSLLPRIADVVLKQRYDAFNGKSLVDLVDPRRVAPTALDRFERDAGPRAFELAFVVRSEPIRLLALSGLRAAADPARAPEYYEKQRRALQMLGHQALAA